MRKIIMLISAVGLALAGFAFVAGTAAAHHTTVTCVGDAIWEIKNSEGIPMRYTTDQGHSGSIGPNGTVEVTHDGTSLTVFGVWANRQTATNSGSGDCSLPPPTETTTTTTTPVDPCSWPAVRSNDAVCVSYNVAVECGSISGSAAHSVSNQPSWVYGVWFSTDLPTGPADGTPGGLSFPEDSGDANVFYWVAGTENDVVRGVPTWTNPAQQSIDTDCEQPTTTTTQPATTTEPPVVTTTPPTPTEPEPTTTVALAPTTTVVDEDPPCEWEVPEGADYRDGFWFDAAGNVIGQAEFEDECVEFHPPVPPSFVTASPALPETL